MKTLVSFGLVVSLTMLSCLPAQSQTSNSWPQWRGPNRTDISEESGLLQQWPQSGPQLLWSFDRAGIGYSGFSIVDDRLFTMGADDDNEFVLCLSVSDGQELWRTSVGKRYTNSWGDGPRSTPTISNGHAFVLSARGDLCCLNVADGNIEWQQNLTDFGGKIPGWGYCESVLVDQGQVVCTPGGSQGAIIAFDEKTGQRKWQSSLFTGQAQYSSIIVADHSDKRHYVQLTFKNVVGIDPDDGSVVWKVKWPGSTAVIPTPIFVDDHVYVSSGYGVGSKLIDISDLDNPKEVWFSKEMKNHHGGVIHFDGHFYGYSDGYGWVCQSKEDGKRVWNNKDDLGKGAIGYADGRFYLISEKSGDVVLIDASPDGWKERGRFQLSPQSKQRKRRGGIWVHPVIVNGNLFLRDQEKIFRYDVRQQ